MALSPNIVHERLNAIAWRYRWLRCLRHLLSGAALSLGILLVLLLADTFFHFGSVTRWISFLFVLMPGMAGLILGTRATLHDISESSIARRIETAAADSRNALISAVQFDRELAINSSFRKPIFEEMRDPFPSVDWARVFDLGLLKRIGIGIGSVVVIMGLYAAFRPLYFVNSAARILMPAKSIAPLTRTRIVSITPGDIRVIHGGDLTVHFELAGDLPKGAWIFTREPEGQWQKVLMEHEVGSNRFSASWKGIRQPFTYRIEAGDANSANLQVTVRPRTAIVTRKAILTPPAYTRLPNETRIDFPALQNVIPGSKGGLTLSFNNPLTQLRSSSEMSVQMISPTEWIVKGVIKENTALKLEYIDTDKIQDAELIPVAIAPDEAPRISISSPAEGKEIFATKTDSLTISFSATDNFGLESVSLYRTSEEKQEAEKIQTWKEAGGLKTFQGTLQVPLEKYARNDRVTLALVAKDQNNITGPGITWSRPIVVTLRSQEQISEKEADTAKKTANNFEMLVKLQSTNLEATRKVLLAASSPPSSGNSDKTNASQSGQLLDRQTQISELTRRLISSSDEFAPEARADLQALESKEMPAAILALRNSLIEDQAHRVAELSTAIQIEAAILVRLQAAQKTAGSEITKARVQDVISGVEELLRIQRDLYRETQRTSATDSTALSQRQDKLADKSVSVRKSLEKSAQDAAIGDQDLRNRMSKVVSMFKEMSIYEQMLAAADKLEAKAFPAAAEIQKAIIANLAKLLELLNQWQFTAAKNEADSMKEKAKDVAASLDKLAQIQREVVEKSKEIARKTDMRPEDLAAAQEMKKGKDLMAEVVEQMLIDAHAFPDMRPANELRGELTQIYEDVIQSDKAEVAAGTLKPGEVAVQKEDSLLKAIEEAKKVAEDLEMWLPTKNDTTKWLDENFDRTEMPEIPNLPLPDAFEDLVGDLLQEQEALAQEVQDAASNQALAQAQQGWEVADGPMPGFSAQGKSGNTRPNKNEQIGRSSGGREGMSNGEMAGETVSNLEGTKPDVRRTNEPMQQGHINDDGGVQEARATGGGKVSGFSDRNGMDGNAPIRGSNAPRIAAKDALAVQQALLAEKTSKTYGQASLLYLKAKGLPEVARLMEQSQNALKEGRTDDFRNLHQRIVGQLKEVKGGIIPGNVISISSGDSPRAQEKQLLGGDEGQAPPAYKKAVTDYYRALQE